MNIVYTAVAVLIAGAAAFYFLGSDSTTSDYEVSETPEAVEVRETTSDTPAAEVEAEAEVVAEPAVEATSEVVPEPVVETPVVSTPEPTPTPEPATPAPVVIDMTGKNFAFSESSIRVPEGAEVTINFQSTGGFHDWVVDEFNARTKQVNTGGQTSVTFTADKKGSFEYYCSVGSHRAQGMVGTLIVE